MAHERLAKNTAWLTGALVAQKALALVYFTIVARAIGVAGTGRYFIAISFTTIFSILIDLGLSNILVRETAKVKEKAQDYLSTALGVKAVLAVGTVILTLIAARILNYTGETSTMITLAAAVTVLDATHLAVYAVMRGFQNLRYEAIGMVIGQIITIVLGTGFIALHYSTPWLIVALFFGSLWNVVWSFFCLYRYYGIAPSFRVDGNILKYYKMVIVPFALAGIFSRLYTYLDSITLSKLASDTEVGYYGAAYKTTYAFQFIPLAFAASVYPAMSHAYVRSREKLSSIFENSLTYLLAIACPLSFGMIAIAPELVRLVYGRGFEGSILPLMIAAPSLIFAFGYWPAGSLLNACDRQSWNTKAMAITTVINALLNISLIPFFGARGASMADVVGNATLFGTTFYFALKLNVRPSWEIVRRGLRIFAVSFAMFLAVVIAKHYVHFVFAILIGIAVYAFGVYASGAITPPEIKKIFGALLRKNQPESTTLP